MKQTFLVRPEQNALSLQQILAQHLSLSNNQAKALLDERGVFINGRRIWMCRHKVHPGDRIELTGPEKTQKNAPTPCTVLFEDDDCLVIDKPAGLLANASPDSAEARIQSKIHPSVRAVHRLDRDTSGCLLLAKNNAAETALIEQFRNHTVKKIYHALVLGSVEKPSGTIRMPLDGQQAVTHYQRLAASPALSCLHVEIDTGRTHQIRRHLASIGNPVAGDKQYGKQELDDPRLRRIPRQMLHAASLTFTPPSAEKPVTVRAPEPKDFTQIRRLFLPPDRA